MRRVLTLMALIGALAVAACNQDPVQVTASAYQELRPWPGLETLYWDIARCLVRTEAEDQLAPFHGLRLYMATALHFQDGTGHWQALNAVWIPATDVVLRLDRDGRIPDQGLRDALAHYAVQTGRHVGSEALWQRCTQPALPPS